MNRNSYFFILTQKIRDARNSSQCLIQECLLEEGGGGGRGRGNISWICYRIFCWCGGEIDCMVL